jgi:hypothetical protein
MKECTFSVPELSRAGMHKMFQKADFDESGCLEANAANKTGASFHGEIFKDDTAFLPASPVVFSRRPSGAQLNPQ